MKIFLAQQNYHIGAIDSNVSKIQKAIQEAIVANGDIIMFPELAICGYPPRDLVEFAHFLEQCYHAIEQLKPLSTQIAILVGCPAPNPTLEGKDLHNSAYFIHEGEVKHIAHKTLLPNYDIFDEYRYFESAKQHEIVRFKGKKLAITICEDIWDVEENPLYNYSPMDVLTQQNPDIILNLSASPYNYTHEQNRKIVLKKNTQKYGIPMLYCNCTGSQTEIVFDGGSLVFDEKGNQILELPQFQEALVAVEWDEQNNFQHYPIQIPAASIPNHLIDMDKLDSQLNISTIYNALVNSIKEYFAKMNFQKAIVASSGGIDSAVTLVLACDALGAENVEALLMPSQYSTEHSVSDAVQLSKNLNNPYQTIAIQPIFDSVAESLATTFKGKPFDVTEENIQSRARGILAMAMSNKFNLILLNTSNKSELATGYGTLYGDMAGGLGVLGDLYKTQVYALAAYINREEERIPNHIITKAPSAELRPDQKDSDSLPDYEVLDQILFQYIERRKGVQAITAQGFDEQLVRRILNMVNKNEYKRNQFCPIIRVSPKAFGLGRRIPIVAKYVV